MRLFGLGEELSGPSTCEETAVQALLSCSSIGSLVMHERHVCEHTRGQPEKVGRREDTSCAMLLSSLHS